MKSFGQCVIYQNVDLYIEAREEKSVAHMHTILHFESIKARLFLCEQGTMVSPLFNPFTSSCLYTALAHSRTYMHNHEQLNYFVNKKLRSDHQQQLRLRTRRFPSALPLGI